MKHSFNKKLLAICIAGYATSVTSALAQSEQASDQTMESIVVVGQATNFVIDAEKIETYAAGDLEDLFRLTPSVSVGGALGIAQKIYVRGLEDSYVNVTVDGAPQASTLFHHIGRVSIDPDLLKEVDVQAGAGEATSGAGSIGGAIRFKTKDVNDLLAADSAFGGRVKAGYFSNDAQQISGSVYGRLSPRWGAMAYYNSVERENFDDGQGQEILGTASDQSLAFVKVSGEFGEAQQLALSYEKRDEEAEFSSRPNWHVQPDDLLYPSEAQRETIIANYGIASGDVVNLSATLYDTVSSFEGGRFNWYTEIVSRGFDIRNTSQLGEHEQIYGIDYRADQVDSGDPLYAQEEGSVLGVYVQSHSQITNQLMLSYGLRYDDYQFDQKRLAGGSGQASSVDGSGVSLNAGLSYELNEHWLLSLGYAEALRGKEVGDGFTIESPEDAGAPFVEGLDPETVTNIEASVEYTSSNVNLKLALFDSEIEDVMFDRLYGGPLYDNAGSVNNSGYEIEFTYQWQKVHLFAGYTDVDAEFDPKAGYYSQSLSGIELSAYEFRHLGNSRGDTFNLGLDYFPFAWLSAGFNLSYVDDLVIDTLYQDVDAGWIDQTYRLEKDGYTTVDFYTKWQATEALSVNLSVINLFDKQYRDHSSVGDYSAVPGYGLVVGPWEPGRDIRLTAAYLF